MKVLVIGRGESGRAAGELAASRGDEVEFADDVGLVVASPGVKVVSELEYGVRALAKRGVRMLAVTGSKGKSSVVKLVADALSLDGRKAVGYPGFEKELYGADVQNAYSVVDGKVITAAGAGSATIAN